MLFTMYNLMFNLRQFHLGKTIVKLTVKNQLSITNQKPIFFYFITWIMRENKNFQSIQYYASKKTESLKIISSLNKLCLFHLRKNNFSWILIVLVDNIIFTFSFTFFYIAVHFLLTFLSFLLLSSWHLL